MLVIAAHAVVTQCAAAVLMFDEFSRQACMHACIHEAAAPAAGPQGIMLHCDDCDRVVVVMVMIMVDVVVVVIVDVGIVVLITMCCCVLWTTTPSDCVHVLTVCAFEWLIKCVVYVHVHVCARARYLRSHCWCLTQLVNVCVCVWS
jgi:hypothetical protein